MPSIVISYRRADTGQIAGRIFDRLEAHFGRDSVFMDIDGIPVGADFRERVQSVLDKCDIVLAVIGPHWADGGQSRDRLADEADWVRIEIEIALAKKVPVVPVLIDQAQLPPAADVPASVRDLVFKQAAHVDTGVDFGAHMQRLIHAIEGVVPAMATQRAAAPTLAPTTAQFPAALFSDHNRGITIGAGVTAVAAIALILLFTWPRTPDVTATTTTSPATPSVSDPVSPPAAALAPAAPGAGDIVVTMENAPLDRDVRVAFERARSASSAATHIVGDARAAVARARAAASQAAQNTPGYGEIDSTSSSGTARHYAGGVRGAKADGYGIITVPTSGSTYSGQLQDGNPVGVGAYARGKLLYEGQFRDGDFEGVGVLNMDSTSTAPERYSGEFKDGVPDGDALHIYAPGNVYFGQWVAGKRNGYGVVFNSDGQLVEQGIYKDDMLVRPLHLDR